LWGGDEISLLDRHSPAGRLSLGQRRPPGWPPGQCREERRIVHLATAIPRDGRRRNSIYNPDRARLAKGAVKPWAVFTVEDVVYNVDVNQCVM
jgi:hypothetical protein